MAKINVTKVEQTDKVSASGKIKYYVHTDEGERHIAWGDWVVGKEDTELDVRIQNDSFQGNDYTVIWPSKEAKASTPPPAAKPAAQETKDTPAPTPSFGEKSAAVQNAITTQHSQEMALRFAYVHPTLVPAMQTVRGQLIFNSLLTKYYAAEARGDEKEMVNIREQFPKGEPEVNEQIEILEGGVD